MACDCKLSCFFARVIVINDDHYGWYIDKLINVHIIMVIINYDYMSKDTALTFIQGHMWITLVLQIILNLYDHMLLVFFIFIERA